MFILWILFTTIGGYSIGTTWFSEWVLLSTSLGLAFGVITGLIVKYGGEAGEGGFFDGMDFSSGDSGGLD